MKLIIEVDSYKQILAENTGKRIGKFVLERKIFEREKIFQQAHLNYVLALKESKCDVIVLELRDMGIMLNISGFKFDGSGFVRFLKPKEPKDFKQEVDISKSIKSAEKYLGVDYIIDNTKEWYEKLTYNKETEKIVDERLKQENYQERFSMTDDQYNFFRCMAYNYESTVNGKKVSVMSDFVYATPKKPKYMHIYPSKHYREKYHDNEVVFSDWFYNKDNIPYTLSTIEQLTLHSPKNKDLKYFAQFIKEYSFYDLLEKQDVIESFATEIEGKVTQFTIINEDVFKAVFIEFSNKNRIKINFHVTG